MLIAKDHSKGSLSETEEEPEDVDLTPEYAMARDGNGRWKQS
jgi:hypothetical protein